MKLVILALFLSACSYLDLNQDTHGVCGTDAAIDSTLVAPDAPSTVDAPAWVCNPNPPTVFHDPTGWGHVDITIDKPLTYSCADAPRPLLVFLGGYGSGTGGAAQIAFGFRYTAKPHGYALIMAPRGLIQPGTTSVKYWNADPAAYDVMGVGNDDVAYLRALIEWTLANYNVDRSRVVVMGQSNGGFMAERLRCSVSDLVTMIVDESGQGQSPTITCPGARPVAAILDHSTADTGVKYNGGTLQGMTVAYPPFSTTLAQNAAQNACSGTFNVTGTYDHDAAIAGDDTDRLTLPGCPVEHWRRAGAHGPVHQLVAGCADTACNVPLQTNFAVDVWAFLQAHPRLP